MFVMRQTYQRRPLVVILLCSLLICSLWVVSGQDRPAWRPAADPQTYSRRVAKATMLYGKPNPLYERAIDSHDRHAKRWGYRMHVLRQDISVGFWNKPSYLVSLVIQELAKPPSERVEWLMWFDADSIIINGAVPLEVFLPPYDISEDVHLVATRDHNGLNTGIIFLHVHPWTINFLIESLGYPLYRPDIDLGRSADQEAMARVLKKSDGGPNGTAYRDGAVFLPRTWINTYEFHHAYEGKRGDLLVHFPGLEEQRWIHMSNWLDIVERSPHSWELPFEETDYHNGTVAFWDRFREAKKAVNTAEHRYNRLSTDKGKAPMEAAVRELKKVMQQEADNTELLVQRMQDLKSVLDLS
ncbi:hypothetical protein BDW42DRAFT_198881 [Aspergillus taichungensis]|uniref:Galactosyl transferase GMA12/MNN10 family-domain-containing protein n=1 Tax=Aspergillus taichungensis TaxID=482145 RepID=A0A2J5I5J0_9EURO|nr:hypothetical protein BDW42DRAFT_198881 [Aspergillus taichungensis]